MAISAEKKAALATALADIEKQFGKGSIMKMSDVEVDDGNSIPTGALCLDMILGGGGVPRGRIVEIYGQESSGKSTLCLSIVAQAQKLGGVAAYVDAEHAMDPIYAQKLGVSINDLLISQPESGEQGLQIVETLVRSGAVDIIIVDSVAALVPQAEIDGDMGAQLPGLQARLMGQALRKLTAVVGKTKTVVIFINQLREKIGIAYGDPNVTPGGKALKFYASIRLDIRRVETIKNGEAAVGNRVKVKTVKNKCAPPFREAIFDIIFGEGISREGAVLDMATDLGIVEKAGSWFAYNGNRIGQGRDAVRVFLKDNQKLVDEIDGKVREEMKKKEEAKEAAVIAKSKENSEKFGGFGVTGRTGDVLTAPKPEKGKLK